MLLFDPQDDRESQRQIKKARDSQTKKEKRLFCSACRHPITHQDERISMQGGHEHNFTNPLGVTYLIGCFCEAKGCEPIGEATLEHTWFQGYAWRTALCANCRVHIGWRFQAGGEYFHGLILKRLTSSGAAAK